MTTLPTTKGSAFVGRPQEAAAPRKRFATAAARDEAIIELAVQGISPAEIERQIYASRTSIYTVLADARREGRGVPLFSTSGRPKGGELDLVQLRINRRVIAALEPHAELRGITAFALARRILEDVVEDNMIDAVLDDGGLSGVR